MRVTVLNGEDLILVCKRYQVDSLTYERCIDCVVLLSELNKLRNSDRELELAIHAIDFLNSVIFKSIAHYGLLAEEHHDIFKNAPDDRRIQEITPTRRNTPLHW